MGPGAHDVQMLSVSNYLQMCAYRSQGEAPSMALVLNWGQFYHWGSIDSSWRHFFFFFFLKEFLYFFIIYLFIYLLLAVLGLRFCARAFSSCGKWGPLFIAMRGPLTIAASLVAEHRLQTRRLSNCGSRA